ncbi:Stf0 family sulfotransferase [Caulobacter sp. S45]|uniref:Stf0 family sulfotransferase n=1 Tax=Caulobacter sp. S45 TaxID=1641861 RepID=UPI0015756CF8|nr:Stf0 family sulfotransferase [Caulobacter sp. S45]
MTTGPDTALVFTTIERPQCARRLISSAHDHHPELAIYVLEQSDVATALEAFCTDLGATYIRLPYDAGVSVARNAATAVVRQPYFIMADDDFVIDRPLPIETARRFLLAMPDFVMVGGDLDEPFRPSKARASLTSHRGRNIAIDQTGGGVILISAEFAGNEAISFENETFYPCDMLSQWGLCDTERFRSHGLQWDERYKTGGEHIDFFLSLKLNGSAARFAYWSGFRCLHDQNRHEPYQVLRARPDWLEQFRLKWGLNYQYTVGGGLRRFDETWGTGRSPETPVAPVAKRRSRPVGKAAKAEARDARAFAPQNSLAGVMDRAEGPSPFRTIGTKLIVACSSRTGSSLLCQALAPYGARMDEFLNPRRLKDFMPEASTADFHEYISNLIRPVSTAFGIKGGLHMMRTLAFFGELPEHIPEWKFVFLTREQVLSQAVSLSIAEKSGVWRQGDVEEAPLDELVYDKAAIQKNISDIRRVNATWETFFGAYGIQPLRMTYERLTSDIPASVEHIADALGLSRNDHQVDWTTIDLPAQQRTRLHREWKREFLRDRAETRSGD